MPTKRFLELDPEKQSRILHASINEFALYGYENSSTNRIIASSGISKGSLFKYFDSKEELYLYALDVSAAEMISDLSAACVTLSTDPFKMAVEYSILEFDWYACHPEKGQLIVRAFVPSDTDIYRKISERYRGQDEDIYHKLLETVDEGLFRYDKAKVLEILKWFLKGFNDEFCSKLQSRERPEPETIREEYISALTGLTEVLRSALMK